MNAVVCCSFASVLGCAANAQEATQLDRIAAYCVGVLDTQMAAARRELSNATTKASAFMASPDRSHCANIAPPNDVGVASR